MINQYKIINESKDFQTNIKEQKDLTESFMSGWEEYIALIEENIGEMNP